MPKRKNQENNKLPPAAKKMADQQNETSASSTQEKMFAYNQGHIDVKPLFLATKLADVHFAFDSGDGTVTRIPAHKNLLAVTSDVFEKMFCGDLKESGDVKIVDASAAAFKEFLQFFYLSEVKLSAEHLATVLYLGNKYNVEKCVDACVEFFTENLSNENVCTALSLAILHEQKGLAHQCEKRILLNTEDVFKSARFLECSKGALTHILKMNLLSCSEVQVFEACMEWVRAQARSGQEVLSKALVEDHLGNLFYQIRFASMTNEEFLTLQEKYSAVLSNDFKAIVRLIEGMDIHSEQFSTLPRHFKWNKDEDAIIECYRATGSSFVRHILDIEEKLTFSTNVPLVLGEFERDGIFFGETNLQNLSSDLLVEAKITEARTLDDANDAKVLCSMIASLGIRTSLPHPIFIRPDFFYTICIKGFPQGHFYISNNRKSSVNIGPNIKIEFHDDKAVDGKIFGLIDVLKFNEIKYN